jgi:hypothetical protein
MPALGREPAPGAEAEQLGGAGRFLRDASEVRRDGIGDVGSRRGPQSAAQHATRRVDQHETFVRALKPREDSRLV